MIYNLNGLYSFGTSAPTAIPTGSNDVAQGFVSNGQRFTGIQRFNGYYSFYTRNENNVIVPTRIYNIDTSSWIDTKYQQIFFPVTTAINLNSQPTEIAAPSLVYDRTALDVQTAKRMIAIGQGAWTAAELQAWNAGLKGLWKLSDHQRIANATTYISTLFTAIGQAKPSVWSDYGNMAVKSFTETKVGYDLLLDVLAEYDALITLPSTVPLAPDNVFGMNFTKANNIERRLQGYIDAINQQINTIYAG